MRVCDAAMEIFRETGNDAVMSTDTALADLIAERAGIAKGKRPHERELAVLNALSRRPGTLVQKRTKSITGRWVRVFRMPEIA